MIARYMLPLRKGKKMKTGYRLTAAVLAMSLMAGSVTAAEARPRGWGNGGGWHDNGWRRHRGDGFGLGDAIGVAALIGAVAVVASSMSKDRAARDANSDYRRPPVPPPPVRDNGYAAERYRNAPDDDFSDIASNDAVPIAGQDSAVDACAIAARDEASRSGGYAEIRSIGTPQPTNGGYDIDGEVERRGSYRDQAGETRRFTCTVQGDSVTNVYLSRDLVSN